MPKVLIISYWFHPFETIGSTRINNFALHLKEFGWEVKVISVKVSKWAHDGRFSNKGIDLDIDRIRGWSWHAFMRKCSCGLIKSGAQERGVQSVEGRNGPVKKLKRWLFCRYESFTSPDECWPWYKFGKKRAIKIAREFQPDVIFSSAMPFSAHQLANDIRKSLNVPWVADYRDLWSPYGIENRSGVLAEKLDKLEKEILSQSNYILSVSPAYTEKVQNRFPDLKTATVYNGFEKLKKCSQRKNDKLRFAYTGIIYPQYQQPEILFKALESSGIDNWEFTYCGPSDSFIKTVIPESIRSNVIVNGMLSKDEAEQIQNDADILVFFTFSVQGWLSGKLMGYLGADKPILAVGPNNEDVKDILDITKCGKTVETLSEAEDFLKNEITDFLNFSPSESRLQFSRLQQSRKLNQILQSHLSDI